MDEQPSPSSVSLSWPLAPGSKRARKQPVQVISEADVPDLPPENASAEEKARILKERRRIKERIREQQRDRSSRKPAIRSGRHRSPCAAAYR